MPKKLYDSTLFWKDEDPLCNPEFEEFLKEADDAIAKAATADLRTRHLDLTIAVLDGVRTSGLDTYHELESKGESPLDPDPFWKTICVLEDHIRKLTNAREGLALFEDENKPPTPPSAPTTKAADAVPPWDSPYLLVHEAALYCRCSDSAIYHAAEKGDLNGSKQGTWRFVKEDLDKWIQARTNIPKLPNNGSQS
jgi:hypothetical protein